MSRVRWTNPAASLQGASVTPTAALPPVLAKSRWQLQVARAFEESYLTDAFTREAVDFVTRHRQEPFLLYLS